MTQPGEARHEGEDQGLRSVGVPASGDPAQREPVYELAPEEPDATPRRIAETASRYLRLLRSLPEGQDKMLAAHYITRSMTHARRALDT